MGNKRVEKKIRELEGRISNDRIIKGKDGEHVCRFCKNHIDDCFCKDNAQLELKGVVFVLDSLKAERSHKTGKDSRGKKE